jgi:uncharacterized protein DUF1566
MKTNTRMNTVTRVAAFAATLAASVLFAGTLDPPGPPAPTAVTLQQIYDKISFSAAVAKTGQTTCYDDAGNVIACAGTGQDGAFKKGAAATPRFTDNGNGTVKDNLTGLIWLKSSNCFGFQTWAQGLASANTLATGACGLTDGSAPGDWRMPNANEILTLTDFGQFNPSLPVGHPFTGVGAFQYWSSTTATAWPRCYCMGFYASILGECFKTDSSSYVWPVRGGQ